MNAVALPLTTGGRPPNLPPIQTTFSGGAPDDGDASHYKLLEGMDRLLQTLQSYLDQPDTPIEIYVTLRDRLQKRRNWIDEELHLLDLVDPESSPSLPPILGFNIDHLSHRLTGQRGALMFRRELLDLAIRDIDARIVVQNLLEDTSSE